MSRTNDDEDKRRWFVGACKGMIVTKGSDRMVESWGDYKWWVGGGHESRHREVENRNKFYKWQPGLGGEWKHAEF